MTVNPPKVSRKGRIESMFSNRTNELFRQHHFEICRRTDLLFGGLLLLEWLVAMGVAYWISPLTWAGAEYQTHVHVWAALFLGGGAAILPALLVYLMPGSVLTRHVVACCQMLFGALFIHLTGGRMETHFHVFGSLALLAFYRDWRVLITGSAVVAADHFLRGMFWPQSVYGVLAVESWRWVEHAGWVVFEDIFLILAITQSDREMREMASRQARLEVTQAEIEQTVQVRTAQLRDKAEQLQTMADQLKGTEEVKEAILRSAGDAIITIDTEGTIGLFNPAAERVFGYAADEVLGKSLARLIPPIFEDASDEHISRYFANEANSKLGVEREINGRRKSGDAFPLELCINQTRVGEKRLFTCILRDLTNRKRIEAELVRARTEAENASRAKGEFLANMSHEIRTPMNGILGMTELALDTELTLEQREYLRTVKSSGEILLNLLNDILDFSKIEAGMLMLDPHDFKLRESLGDMMKTLSLRAHQKGLELLCDIAPNVPEHLVGDSFRLRQVLVNLLGNAIKFTQRGEVVLSVQVDGADPDVLCFAVRDTGIGIPTEKQARVFESFTQADGSTTRHFGGTGLGLAISAQLVGMMDGKLRLSSEVARGSTFYFNARFIRREPDAGDTPRSLAALEGMPVLIVDDNETNRVILEKMLRTVGMVPSCAVDGAKGLAELRRAAASHQPYALVLMDVLMPNLDGFGAIDEIRKDSALAGAAVMMLSSADRGQDVARCRALGVTHYLVKPIQQSELIKAMLRAVGSGSRSGLRPLASDIPGIVVPQPLTILLAEDNEVNRELALNVLRKRGHEVITAQNGREAVDAYEAKPFDVVLMDVQMPEMDGIEATALIRAKEKTTGTHTPIIALTAHAMAGDRERFLASGMDAFVAKPLRSPELFAALDVLTVGKARVARSSRIESAAGESRKSRDVLLDREATLERVEGDRELLSDLIKMFIAQTRKLLSDIRESIGRTDGATLERAAHKLKGTVGTFGARKVVESAQSLEISGRLAQWNGVEETFSRLETQIAQLTWEMQEWNALETV
jgi:two-component system sensor histidine kinase/response regulator